MDDTALVADPDPSPTYPSLAVRRSASSLRAAPTARSNSQSSRPANGGRNATLLDSDYRDVFGRQSWANDLRAFERRARGLEDAPLERVPRPLRADPPDLIEEPTIGQILIDGATIAMLAATLWLLWLWAAALE